MEKEAEVTWKRTGMFMRGPQTDTLQWTSICPVIYAMLVLYCRDTESWNG